LIEDVPRLAGDFLAGICREIGVRLPAELSYCAVGIKSPEAGFPACVFLLYFPYFYAGGIFHV